MKKIFVFISLFIFAVSCKEVYNPPLSSPATGYLVVDGFINSNGGTSTITLTRTTKLSDSVFILYEHNAQVQIEGEGNEVYPMPEGVNGTYTSAAITLNAAEKYRVRIRTTDGKEYLSEYASVKGTPVIDSISWLRGEDGVTTYINTHDDANNTKYYRWTYAETWQIRSAYYSTIRYLFDDITGLPTGVEYRYPDNSNREDTTILNCWQSYTAKNIILGTTEKLSSDKIYLPLTHIEPQSIKLSVLYSVELKQYALSKGAYSFYEQLKKNTESLGSIFDAQPSELKGNIQCTTDPAEIVVGYIDVSQEQTKRLFINSNQLDSWGYSQGCSKLVVVDNNIDSIRAHATGLFPTIPNKLGPFGVIINFYVAEPECVDCTLRGSNKRPSFWP
ncbi:DUF4249 domain-containing protein [Panacibacter ginsenosidivorans]|uniref:DUF4249 domain-containing protein n=1 Tax=Panacibacter ginsenosidivorans TaxID=1813871 RepID=A0A5B8V405_9BACT|nr:DUF4249 domain-containing protein [Panacibacter ginsenosidivorans]QEC66114.1 DUF4249 domain-containing protein [Panacibacter ginsenosidivorans]